MLEYAMLENTINLHAAREEWADAARLADEQIELVKGHLSDGLFAPTSFLLQRLEAWRDTLVERRDKEK